AAPELSPHPGQPLDDQAVAHLGLHEGGHSHRLPGDPGEAARPALARGGHTAAPAAAHRAAGADAAGRAGPDLGLSVLISGYLRSRALAPSSAPRSIWPPRGRAGSARPRPP